MRDSHHSEISFHMTAEMGDLVLKRKLKPVKKNKYAYREKWLIKKKGFTVEWKVKRAQKLLHFQTYYTKNNMLMHLNRTIVISKKK